MTNYDKDQMSIRLSNNSLIEIRLTAKPLKVYVDGFTPFFYKQHF